MLKWAIKTLFSQPGNLLGSVFGVAAAFILVVFFAAVWRGESEQIVAYPRHMAPDLWVMQSGVANMHMAMSFVWDWKGDVIGKMPEVEQATPILYFNTVINADDKKLFVFLVGYKPEHSRVGPWKVEKGQSISGPGQIILPQVLAQILGLELGDKMQITDKQFEIIGLSQGTYSSANPVLFVDYKDLESILSAAGTFSYLLVDAKPGVDVNRLAQKIKKQIDKVNVIVNDDLIENEFSLAKQMGVEIIQIITLISSVLAALIISFTSYSLVVRRRREIAIIKALGRTPVSVVIAVLFQSFLLTLMGFILAVLFGLYIVPMIPQLVPQITVVVTLEALLQLGMSALVISLVAALAPSINVVRLDPASAFHL